MTALRREALQLVEQMPEEQMRYVIQYMRALKDKGVSAETIFENEKAVTPKMKAFLELEKMLVPMPQELDYDKELEAARNEKYGYFN